MGKIGYIQSIQELECTIKDLPKEARQDFDEKNLVLNFTINMKPQEEDNAFAVTFGVKYAYILKGKESISLLNFIVQVSFELDDIMKYKQDNEVVIPDDLITRFVQETISTARGIMYVRSFGTFIGRFQVPVIDAKKLLVILKEKPNPNITRSVTEVLPKKKKKKNESCILFID